MSELILNFPEGDTPRPKQVEALRKIEKAFASGKKYVIVHADTGVGKSHISKTLGNISRDSSDHFKSCVSDYTIFGEDGATLVDDKPFGCYALTITKSLQDQYQKSFEDTGVLKGQSNYQCDVDEDFTVDLAPCIYVNGLKNECWKACRCPYYNARNEMILSKFSSLNYSMFFSLPEHLRKREYIVCDEGSELEEQLVSQFTTEVDFQLLMRCGVMVTPFPSKETPKTCMDWASTISRKVEAKIIEYKEFFKDPASKKDNITFQKKKGEYKKLSDLSNSLLTLVETYFDSEYIVEHLDKKIKFIPLKVDVLSKYLFNYGEKVVIMSATIIDPKAYCKSLGIKESECEYFHIDTDFEPKKSPIHIMAKQKLNYNNMKSMLPKLMEQIQGIMEHHKDEKGIIHTHTQYNADYIREHIQSDRLLCREPGVRNEELLEMHEESDKPTILVSPSMTYGVDLKGDLGKFQIILKAPWLPTKDVRVSKLMQIDKSWYGNQMLKTLVQACGRSVRGDEDECETYILDGSIYDAVSRNKSKLPKFFLERFN